MGIRLIDEGQVAVVGEVRVGWWWWCVSAAAIFDPSSLHREQWGVVGVGVTDEGHVAVVGEARVGFIGCSEVEALDCGAHAVDDAAHCYDSRFAI